jgi:hypothetical protein
VRLWIGLGTAVVGGLAALLLVTFVLAVSWPMNLMIGGLVGWVVYMAAEWRRMRA